MNPLSSYYSQMGEVEIHLDRREGQTCAWRGHSVDRRIIRRDNTDLQTKAFMVVRER